MKQFLAKVSLGTLGSVVMGVVAPPLAPVGGGIGYAFGEFLFDDEKLEPEELAAKYLVKVCIFTVVGSVGGLMGEHLAAPIGEIFNDIGDLIIPEEITEAILEAAKSNPEVMKALEDIYRAIPNLPLSKDMQKVLLKTYCDSVNKVIELLAKDGMLEELLGEIAGRQAFNPATQYVAKVVLDMMKVRERIQVAFA